jgi:hypothetical protein
MSDAVKKRVSRLVVGRHRADLVATLVAGRPVSIEIRWDRAHPPRLSRAELARYRQLRNAMLASMGMSALVVDVHADGSTTLTDIGTPGR